jgi:hypothetical protein
LGNLKSITMPGTSKIYCLPVNREIIDAVVPYHFKGLNVSEEQINKEKLKYYSKYLDGESACFVLLILNNGVTSVFNKLDDDISLQDESTKYEILKYTRIFDTSLMIGESKGYIYFENFRKTRDNNSYSIHFNNYVLKNENNESTYKNPGWAFSYNESEINFMSLVNLGVNETSLREQYFISTQIDINTVLTLISMIVTIVK